MEDKYAKFKEGHRFFRSDIGQKEIYDQFNLERGAKAKTSLFGTKRGDIKDSSLKHASKILKSDDGKILKYSKSAITGGHADLEKSYQSVIESMGKNQHKPTGHYSQMTSIRHKNLARKSYEKKGVAGWLGLSDELDEVAKVNRHGGGVENVYRMQNFEAFSASRASQHLSRAVSFGTFAGAGTDVMNSVGLMTRHQKDIIKSNSVDKLTRASTAAIPILGGVFGLHTAMPYVTGEKETTLTDNVITGVASTAASIAASTYAFRVTKEATHMGTSLLTPRVNYNSFAGKALAVGKMATGIATGLAAGFTVGIGADMVTDQFRSMSNLENNITRLKRKAYEGDINGDTSIMTNQLMTARQRTLNKLSKSSLNDRASLMGNEAMILKGIL